jgi:hypothetical protein
MSTRPISPSRLPSPERDARSHLHQLLSEAEGFLHGSLIILHRRCGEPSCRCASDDKARHASLCLGRTHEGKTTMIHIPRDMEARVRQWVDNHQRATEMLRQLDRQGRPRLAQAKAAKSPPESVTKSKGAAKRTSQPPRKPS